MQLGVPQYWVRVTLHAYEHAAFKPLLHIPFSTNVTFPDVQTANSKGSNVPSYFEGALKNNLDGPSALLLGGHGAL